MISVTNDGYAIQYSLDYKQRRGVITHKELELENDYKNAVSVAVCSKNQYFLVEIGSSYYTSRMIILKLSIQGTLYQRASIDLYNQWVGEKYALESLGYIGRHSLWVGLSKERDGFIQVYDFDTKTGELKELEEKRRGHGEECPFRLHCLGDEFYYIGYLGKLMKLTAKI